jgi:hypothetical protein
MSRRRYRRISNGVYPKYFEAKIDRARPNRDFHASKDHAFVDDEFLEGLHSFSCEYRFRPRHAA